MNIPLYTSLHERGLTQAKLATLVGIHRTVLARILTNEPGRGKETRYKLFSHLNATEIELLGWDDEFLQWRRQETAWPKKPPTQSSTSNIVP